MSFSASSAYWQLGTLVLVVPKPDICSILRNLGYKVLHLFFDIQFSISLGILKVKRSLYMFLYLLFLQFFFLFVFFGFPWHFGLVSRFWFHLMYIRKVHGFLQLLYMHSRNCEYRFLFLCCQSVSSLIFHQLGFYCRFLLFVFHF